IVFDSLGSAKTYDRLVSWSVYDSGKPGKRDGYRGQAEWFLANINGRLKTIEVATRSVRPNGGQLNVSIAEDANGIPGKVLEHFSVLPSAVGNGSILALKSMAKPKLQAGQKYWLCAEPADASSQWSWYFNNQNLAKGFAYAFERGQW